MIARYHPACHFDQFSNGEAEGDFVEAGAGDVTGEAEEFGAGGARVGLANPGALGSPGFEAHIESGEEGEEGFDVVDGGGLIEQAIRDGEGGFDAGEATFAFDGFKKGGFFAADVCACAEAEFDIKVEAFLAEDVFAEIPC